MSKLAGTATATLSEVRLFGSAPASTGIAAQAASFRLSNSGSGRCLINTGGSISGTFTGRCDTGVNQSTTSGVAVCQHRDGGAA